MYKLGLNKVQIEPLLIMNNSKDKLSSPNKDKFGKNYIKVYDTPIKSVNLFTHL